MKKKYEDGDDDDDDDDDCDEYKGNVIPLCYNYSQFSRLCTESV